MQWNVVSGRLPATPALVVLDVIYKWNLGCLIRVQVSLIVECNKIVRLSKDTTTEKSEILGDR